MRGELGILAGLAGVALVSMAVFAWGARGPRRRRSEEVARRGTFLFGDAVREWFYWVLAPAQRAAVSWGLAPEVFNALGLALALGAGAGYAAGKLPLAGALLLASGLTDAFDGLVARGRGVASPRGAFLDSTLDRFAELAVFAGLAAFYGERGPVLLVLAALGGSLLVSYTRARGEGLGITCQRGILQRAERVLLLGLGSILDPAVSSRWGRGPGSLLVLLIGGIALGSLGTALYRTAWIARRLGKRRRPAGEGPPGNASDRRA